MYDLDIECLVINRPVNSNCYGLKSSKNISFYTPELLRNSEVPKRWKNNQVQTCIWNLALFYFILTVCGQQRLSEPLRIKILSSTPFRAIFCPSGTNIINAAINSSPVDHGHICKFIIIYKILFSLFMWMF